MGEKSAQMRIPSTGLEPSTGSMSQQPSAKLQRQQQPPIPQNQQTQPGSVHDEGVLDEARQAEIEKDISRKLEALSAAAKATNQKLAEVATGPRFVEKQWNPIRHKRPTPTNQEELGEAAWSSSGDVEKPHILTRTSGRILLRINVVTRYFDAHGISTGGTYSSGVSTAAQDARLAQQLSECKEIFAAYLRAAEREAEISSAS
ncbi:hypothetical protein ACSSS7_002734 [Eimeria intestinalis]